MVFQDDSFPSFGALCGPLPSFRECIFRWHYRPPTFLKTCFFSKVNSTNPGDLDHLEECFLGIEKNRSFPKGFTPRRGSEVSLRGQVSLGSPTHGSRDSFCDSLWGSDLGFFITRVRKITWIVLNVEKKNWTRPFFWHFDPWSLSKTFLRSIILIIVGERIWRFEGWTAKRANLSNPSPPYDHHRA